MMANTAKLAVFMAGVFLFGAAVADFDGSDPLICSFGQIFECDAGKSKCRTVSHENVDAPDFIKLDFRKKQIISINAGEQGSPDAIDNVQDLDDYLIVQGVQGGSRDDTLAWSASISHETGQIVVTGAGEKAGFVVFGACVSM